MLQYGGGKLEISIIIPCYNESKQILTALANLRTFMEKLKNVTYEIITVNDGSVDNTLDMMQLWSAKHQQIITYPENRGKGYAVHKGIQAAKYDNILILDADLSVQPKELIATMKEQYMDSEHPFAVIGQRIQVESQPPHRLVLGWCFRKLTETAFSLEIPDTQCPYKILHKVKPELTIEGFAYDVELILWLKQNHIPIYKQKVDYYNQKDSKVTFKKTLLMLEEMKKIKKKYG